MKHLLTTLFLFANFAFAGDSVIDYPWDAPKTILEDRISRIESELGIRTVYWNFDSTKSDKKIEVWFEIKGEDGGFKAGDKFVLGSVGPKKGFLSLVTKGKQIVFSTPMNTVANVVRSTGSSQTVYSEHDKGFLLRCYDTSGDEKTELYRVRWQIQEAE